MKSGGQKPEPSCMFTHQQFQTPKGKILLSQKTNTDNAKSSTTPNSPLQSTEFLLKPHPTSFFCSIK